MGGAREFFDRTPTLAEMAALAAIVRDAAGNDGEEACVALAWAVLNRRAGTRSRPGDGRFTPTKSDFADPAFWRALGAACRAWTGDVPDPTRGATRFHLHTDYPRWAQQTAPNALIGKNFFYPPDPPGIRAPGRAQPRKETPI